MAKIKKGKIILISISAVIVLIIVLAGTYLYGALYRTTDTPLLKNAFRYEKWKADLTYVKTQLPKLHKNLFFSKTKTDYDKEMNFLLENIRRLDDKQIKAGLAECINSVNDSHTSVVIKSSKQYPLSFFEYEEGIYLSNSSLAYKALWGRKLSAVNGYSTEQLRMKLDPFLSHDNKAITKSQFCTVLRNPDFMKIAGIFEYDDAIFTFEDGAEKTDISVKPLSEEDFMKERFLSDVSEYSDKFPLPRQTMDKDYWFIYDEKTKAVYIKYNSCANSEGYSFADFTKDVFKAIDKNKAKALIVDLRDNGGGNSMIFNPFLREIRKHDTINKKDSLFVIVGRRTFSSAIINAMDLRNGTNAVLIGEPTGGRPNHFGEVKVLHLSNVNIDITYSSKFFKTAAVDTDSIYPDISVPTTAKSFFNGKDDCLEYIYSKITG